MESNLANTPQPPIPSTPPIPAMVFNLPTWVGTAYTTFADKIVFVTIAHDHDCPNPNDDNGMGKMYSLSQRHNNYKPLSDIMEIVESDPDAVVLSYYEHGDCAWFPKDFPVPPGVEFKFDGRKVAGLWIPDNACRESYLGTDTVDSRHAWMVQQAGICCEVYTQWCNGECFGYDVEVYQAILGDDGAPMDDPHDYRRRKPVQDFACWGFIGWDTVVQAANEALEVIGV